MYVVRWTAGDSKGYDDHIPDYVLQNDGLLPKVEHAIVGPRNWLKIARCSLEVSENLATFDYGAAHRSWNEDQGFYIGKMQFQFDTALRSGNPQLSWKDEKDKRFLGGFGYVTRKELPAALSAGQAEGNKRLRTHLESERYPAARLEKLKDSLQKDGTIVCEVCKADYTNNYGPGGLSAYEVHHRRPIQDGARITSLTDLAVLCANCHRVIHATDPLQSVEEFAKCYVFTLHSV